MTLETGKPLGEARAEVAYAAEFFRWFSEEAVRIDGRYTVAPGGGAHMMVMNNRLDRRCSSPRGIFRWPWPPARSARQSPPAAP